MSLHPNYADAESRCIVIDSLPGGDRRSHGDDEVRLLRGIAGSCRAVQKLQGPSGGDIPERQVEAEASRVTSGVDGL